MELEGCEPTESILAGILSSSKVVVSSATLKELNVHSTLLAAVIQAKKPYKGHYFSELWLLKQVSQVTLQKS